MRRSLLTLALGLAIAVAPPCVATAQSVPAADAQSDIAVAQGRRLLEAIAQQDDAAFLSTLHALFPSSKQSDANWLDLRRHWRGFAFHGGVPTGPGQADLQVYDRDREDWVWIAVAVDPAPSNTITRFSIHAGQRPADVPPPPKLAPAALAAAAKQKAAAEAEMDRFSGVLLLSHRGHLVLEESYGLADRERRVPVRSTTKLRIASMGKMFTTVAVLQLAQAGKLDLKAPISRYLPDYPNGEVAAKATVDDLLNHAAGTGDFFGPEFDAQRNELIEPKDYIARFGARSPEFPPGTAQAYSNFGFVVLGRIVEVVSGQPFDRYVEDHIFRPAGMKGSGYVPENVNVPERAVGYSDESGALAPATHYQVYKGTPAGGGYSTGPDLIRFAEALMGGRLLEQTWLDRLTRSGTQLRNGKVSFYDFANRTREGTLVLGHGGAAPGQNGLLHIFPDSGYTVVVLANRDPAVADRIAKFIEDRIP